MKRTKVESAPEKQIIRGMIASDLVLQEISDIYEDHFLSMPFAKDLAQWCIEYFDIYKQAPKRAILEILDSKREDGILSQEIGELYSKALSDILEPLTISETINDEYYLNEAFKYFDKQNLTITQQYIKQALDANDITTAKELLNEYTEVERSKFKVIDAFSDEMIDQIFDNTEEDFFKMPGKLGEFMGPMGRGWLACIQATWKKGKTFFLSEIAIQAVLRKLNVIFFTFEMQPSQIAKRLNRRLVPLAGDNETDGIFSYPVFDCLKNQNNSCSMMIRRNKVALPDPPIWRPNMQYQPCDLCRNDLNDNFEEGVWYEPQNRLEFTQENLVKGLKRLKNQFKAISIPIKFYPRYSANIRDIEGYLNTMQRKTGIAPDVIIIDYADILKPEANAPSGFEGVDITWVNLAKLAAERQALVVTATQATRESDSKVIQQATDVGRWIGKHHHVDCSFGLNQSTQEKAVGKIRINTIAHRHKDFLDTDTCSILQNLSHGQSLLDSY